MILLRIQEKLAKLFWHHIPTYEEGRNVVEHTLMQQCGEPGENNIIFPLGTEEFSCNRTEAFTALVAAVWPHPQ